jgi:hypothetical protein
VFIIAASADLLDGFSGIGKTTFMKNLVLVFGILILASCGGSLTDEQRKRLKEGMETHKIVRVTDSEIVSASLDEGRAVYKALENIKFDSTKTDSIARHYHVKIRWVVPGASHALDIENQLIEAYVMGASTGSIQDNIQKLNADVHNNDMYDSLLYSKPVVTKMPDGVDRLDGVWNIYLAKKEIVMELSRK